MDAIDALTKWMMTDGRVSGDPVAAVSHFCDALREAGVPLWRVNIGQRFANPLLRAWGVIWTPETTERYDVTHARMLTDAYVGSSFEYVLQHRQPLHKSLRGLDPETAHTSYLELAEAGGSDYYASLLSYGDGTFHGCTFVTRSEEGFLPAHLALIEAALPALACALEPVTMRMSAKSLLRAYLGDGPSQAVWNGAIIRGARTTVDAVVMFTDLRGFTAMSDSVSEDDLFDALNGYFDVVVQAVEDMSGDVLKFMGDGILSVFTIPTPSEHDAQCRLAVGAAEKILAGLAVLNEDRAREGKPALDIGIGVNSGHVSYGNIGSPGRLDFTVLGGAVNVASRIEGLTKSIGRRVLVTSAVAAAQPDVFRTCGTHQVRGIARPIEIFCLAEARRQGRF